MRLRLNREFATRHLAVALLMLGLGGWFAWDGFVVYPRMTPAELYRSIEHSEPQSAAQAEKVAANAIARQREFMLLAVLFSLFLAVRVWLISRETFPSSFAGAKEIDTRDWKKKGILRCSVNGKRITLDAWHHQGVKEIVEKCLVPSA